MITTNIPYEDFIKDPAVVLAEINRHMKVTITNIPNKENIVILDSESYDLLVQNEQGHY